MRKSIKKILVTTLAVTLLVPSINVSAYTFNKKVDSDVYEVSDIKNLQMIKDGATTDIKMLNDIVERAYNNDFQNKSYIIKTDEKELNRYIDVDGETYDLWSNYLHSRGDVYIAATLTEKSVVYDEGNDYYYHSISVTSKPYWDAKAGYFNSEERKLVKYNDYITKIRGAEKEMGFVEGNDLCDYELIQQAYIWIRDHVKSSSSAEYNTGGQTAMEGIFGGATMCAGQSRLFNRFMHDFGIDSYWTSFPSKNHAYNSVRLSNNYYTIDCNSTCYEDSLEGKYSFTTLNYICQEKSENILKGNAEIYSIMMFNNEYKLQLLNSTKNDLRIPNVSSGRVDSKLITSDDNPNFHYEADGWTCNYCGKTHNFENTKTLAPLRVKESIVVNAGFEVYNNRFNYNTGGYDNFLKIEQGTKTEYETNTTTAAPTTTEEPTSDDSEVTKETTAPDVEVPTTTKSEVEVPTTTEPEVEVPTTASRPEPTTSDRVTIIPTKAETSTTIKPTKKPEPTTTVKNGTSNIKNYNCSIDKKEEDNNNIKLSIKFNVNKKYTHVKVEYKDKATNKKTLKWVKVSNNKADVTIPKKSKNTVYDIKVTGVKVKIGKAKIKNVKVRKRSITFKVTCKGAKKIKITYKKKGKVITKWIKVNKRVTLKGLSKNKKYKIKAVGTIDKSSTSPKGKSATKKVTTK